MKKRGVLIAYIIYIESNFASIQYSREVQNYTVSHIKGNTCKVRISCRLVISNKKEWLELYLQVLSSTDIYYNIVEDKHEQKLV